MAGNYMDLSTTILHQGPFKKWAGAPTTATEGSGTNRNIISLMDPQDSWHNEYGNATTRFSGKNINPTSNLSYGIPILTDARGAVAIAYECEVMGWENQGTDRIQAHFIGAAAPNIGSSVSGNTQNWVNLPSTGQARVGIQQQHIVAKGIFAIDLDQTAYPDSAVWIACCFVNNEVDIQQLEIQLSIAARVVGSGKSTWNPFI